MRHFKFFAFVHQQPVSGALTSQKTSAAAPVLQVLKKKKLLKDRDKNTLLDKNYLPVASLDAAMIG